jgi:AraC-like DNA-binding protein
MIQPAVLEGESPRAAYDHRLFLILQGAGYLFLNGNRIPLKENMLIIMKPGEEYYFSGKIKAAVLNFDMTRQCSDRKQPLTPSVTSHYDIKNQFDRTQLIGFTNPIVMLSNDTLNADILEIVETLVKGDPFSDALCSALLKKVLITLLSTQNNTYTPAQELCNNVLCYVKTNAAELKNNQDVARKFGYHPFYLANLFKSETGKTLSEAILEEKLQLACRWLLTTTRSIEEISSNTGFSSRNYFCTVFKRFYGVSPLQYRKQYLTNHNQTKSIQQ